MNFKTLFQNDDRAVSPVIGVILMVAITVILAAVIGTFVLGLGDSLGDNQPSAQLSVADAGDGNITIDHNGGDTVNLDNLDVVVRDGSTTLERETVSEFESVSELNGTISVGDSARLAYNNSNGDSADNIRLIHTPSDSIILDRNVDAFDFDEWVTDTA